METFGKDFHAWWAELQPAERARGSDGFFIRDDNAEINWTCLRSAGKYGLWTVVAALCFWGIALGSDEERLVCSSWHQAVTDFDWVLVQLMKPQPPHRLVPSLTASTGRSKTSKRGPMSTSIKGPDSENDRPSTRAATRKREQELRPATRASKRKSGDGDAEAGRCDGRSAVLGSKRYVLPSLFHIVVVSKPFS